MAEREFSGFFRIRLALACSFLGLLPATPFLSALEPPRDNSKAVKELEDVGEARRLFEEAEVVLSADIKSAKLARMGFGGPPVPAARIFFENVTALKGVRPETEKTAYHYRASPKTLEKYRGRAILAALSRRGPESPLVVTGIFPATSAFYEILDTAVTQEKCADEPEPACAPAGAAPL